MMMTMIVIRCSIIIKHIHGFAVIIKIATAIKIVSRHVAIARATMDAARDHITEATARMDQPAPQTLISIS